LDVVLEGVDGDLQGVAGIGAPSATWASMIRRASPWSALGACTASGVSENATTPTRILLGRLSRKLRAARWAAARRLGLTSVAFIEPEWSVTSMIEARCTATATVSCGLARETTSAASAASASAAGQVAPPRGYRPRSELQGGHGGEAHGVAFGAAPARQIRGEGGRDDQQAQQPQRRGEAHRCLRRRSSGTAANATDGLLLGGVWWWPVGRMSLDQPAEPAQASIGAGAASRADAVSPRRPAWGGKRGCRAAAVALLGGVTRPRAPGRRSARAAQAGRRSSWRARGPRRHCPTAASPTHLIAHPG
jgi:hypothetical protein